MKPAGIMLGMGREKLDPTPGVSRGGPGAESSGTFDGISAPGAAENRWKRTFLLGKKIAGTIWDFKGISGNPELLFPLFVPKKNVDFDCLKVQKIPFSFIIEGIYSRFQAKIPRLKLLLSFFVFQEFGN